MIDLSRFLINPFDDKKVSLARLLAFTADHLGRLIANNPGGTLTARITATSEALEAVEDGVSDDLAKLGLRKARVQVKNDFRTSLAGNLARIAAAVTAKYGDGTPESSECFPQGRGVFGICRDDQLAAHLRALVTGLTALQPALGAAVVTDAANLLAAWTTIHDAGTKSVGAKTMTQEAKQTAREALQAALFINLLEIARLFPGQPEHLALFMRQSLLEGPQSGEPEAPAAPTPVVG